MKEQTRFVLKSWAVGYVFTRLTESEDMDDRCAFEDVCEKYARPWAENGCDLTAEQYRGLAGVFWRIHNQGYVSCCPDVTTDEMTVLNTLADKAMEVFEMEGVELSDKELMDEFLELIKGTGILQG